MKTVTWAGQQGCHLHLFRQILLHLKNTLKSAVLW